MVHLLLRPLVELGFHGDGEEVRQHRPVEGGEEGDRHSAAYLAWVVEVGEHLDKPDQRAHHSDGGSQVGQLLPHFLSDLVALLKELDLLRDHVLNDIRRCAVHQQLQPLPQEWLLDAREAVLKHKNAVASGYRRHLHYLLHQGDGVLPSLPERDHGHLKEFRDLRHRKADQHGARGAAEHYHGSLLVHEKHEVA